MPLIPKMHQVKNPKKNAGESYASGGNLIVPLRFWSSSYAAEVCLGGAKLGAKFDELVASFPKEDVFL